MTKRQQIPAMPRDKTTDKAFVLSVLRAVSRNLKSIDGIVEAAGIGLSQGLVSPSAAISMVNKVAPGCFEAVLQDFEAAEIGAGYSLEAAE
jgi:hypothetical protein